MKSIYIQRVMEINSYWDFGKTKPIKANRLQVWLGTGYKEKTHKFE